MEAEEIGGSAEIAVDQFIQGEFVVASAFFQISQKILETSSLEHFQLLLHGFQVRPERQQTAIIKDQVVGWVDALQIKQFVHRCPQCHKFSIVQ